ncbi:MAG: cyclase family protein [Gammaproteobacteria bacterium]|nr:cyclase family protein [Gammaproteobacteria bacterium]MCP5199497.1 cyclase family protein [Gammaproteobacteria bacterium]
MAHAPHTDTPELTELLRDAPKNWGKWGPDDEVGSLNYLTPEVVIKAAGSIRSGKVFTLQCRMANPEGDPVWPGRQGATRVSVIDEGHWVAGKGLDFAGGLHYADDYMTCFPQGSTQYDALGHVWYDDQIWNGYDAKTTIGGLSKASIEPIAERGVVGRGILLDIARWRGKDALDPAETFTHEDLMACARAQGAEIRQHDILVVRTGWIAQYYEKGEAEFFKDFVEPGLTHSKELVQWFCDMEIPNLVTDTIANEVTVDPVSGVVLPLHNALMRNLGVTLTEIAWLEDLAADCAEDGQYTFLYTAAPLKIVNGAGAPVNPVVIK